MRKYDEVSKHDESIISYAITRLLKKKKLAKIQYCKEWKNGKCVEYYKRVDYILDEHLKDPELLQYLKNNGLVTDTNEGLTSFCLRLPRVSS
ncbi:hypothetical protein [Stygiolobus caldivivus]|uniref:Uncharacterized protein n=1 Tax=Stygiolobus caldivivus TaxID=2824673 RepID=A0A8D5ZGU7_9CREN|nr:hypothetical protein [Stygiolobus caldivivus]BCU71263.1 hypothetical protein KN1_25600 [Stygiolobus caldivivus]